MIGAVVILGLVANLIGVIKIFRSVKSASSYLPDVYDERKGKSKPVALLDEKLSREGLRIIGYGVSAQLLAMISSMIFK